MEVNSKIQQEEQERLNRVVKQIQENYEACVEKTREHRASLKEINKSMLSEFKFETESMVDLEGAAVLHQYQTMGQNVENAMDYQKQRAMQLKRLYQSAYFAKIVFKEEQEEEEAIYIGPASLVEEGGFDYLIYDWRAPICSIFYDYEKGPVTYKAPAGDIEGELLGKRHFKIKEDTIHYMFDSNMNIMDEMLKETLAKSADDKMKTIITTIQKEQNQVIRDEEADVLIVRGSAGSGKTSIALHRIAYLLYRNREKILPTDILIFTPNDIFADYISHVLPELGEQEVESITFGDYMTRHLGVHEVAEDMDQENFIQENDHDILKTRWTSIESYFEQMEFLLSKDALTSEKERQNYDKRVCILQKKTSEAFLKNFEDYISHVEQRDDLFWDVYVLDQCVLTKADILEAYLDCIGIIKCSSRLLQVRNRAMEKVTQAKKALAYQYEQQLIKSDTYYTKADMDHKTRKYVKRIFKPIYRDIRRMTSLDLLELYNNFLKTQGLETIQNGHLSYEDALCMLYMKGRLDTIKEVSKIKHLVIDEAQDYTYLHYKIIQLIFGHCRYTLLGDPNQGIHPYLASQVNGQLEVFLGENPQYIHLSKTYRSTKQISDFCNQLLGLEHPDENILRDGDEPTTDVIAKEDGPMAVANKILDFGGKGCQSIAVIAKTKAHARLWHEQLLSVVDEPIGLVDDEDQKYEKGHIVIPSFLAKGLEFDGVIVVTDEQFNYEESREKKLIYTACSRALHQLALIHIDENKSR